MRFCVFGLNSFALSQHVQTQAYEATVAGYGRKHGCSRHKLDSSLQPKYPESRCEYWKAVLVTERVGPEM